MRSNVKQFRKIMALLSESFEEQIIHKYGNDKACKR